MFVSRCRYWWCSRCKAVFEKEDLKNKIELYGGSAEVAVVGTRTCGHCQAAYQMKDVYAGKHDVPRQFWGQLQPPVELPGGEVRANTGRRSRVTSSRPTVLTAWLLCVVSVASGLAMLGYVIVKPLIRGG